MRAAVFHGVEIPESLLAQEAQHHPGLSAAEARAAAGNALATKALLLRRAEQLGLAAEPELDEDGREETPEAALIRAVLEAELVVTPPTEAECRRVYDANRGRFRSQALYEASHILIEPKGEGAAAGQAAFELAYQLARDAHERPAAFADMAAILSDCPSGKTGGSLGQLRPGDLVAEIEQAIARLAPGEVAQAPVRSRFGWHVLRLDRRIEGADLPFEAVRERIRLHLESRAWGRAASAYVIGLAAAARDKGVALTLSEAGSLADGSACLGDFLGDGEAAARLEAWLDASDPALCGRLREAASAAGVTPSALARSAAAAFFAEADDERWTQLISAAQGGQDPAVAALAAILRAKLEPPRRSFTVISRRGAGTPVASVHQP